MRRTLLTLATIAMGVCGALASGPFKAPGSNNVKSYADEANSTQLVFGYCDGYDQGIGTGGGGTLDAAIEIPASTVKYWVGNKISQIRVGFGTVSEKYPEINVYITEDLKGEPLYTEEVILMTTNGWNNIELATPFDITEAKTLFIGYSYKSAAGDYPIGVDGVTTDSMLGDYLGIDGSWGHYGSGYGNVCIQVVLEGDNLPQNMAIGDGLTLPFATQPGKTFTAIGTFVNQGAQPITEIGFELTVDGKTVENPRYAISPSVVESGKVGTITISRLETDHEITDVPVVLTITSVNGAPNENTDYNSIESAIACFTEGVGRKMVVEEWTGTWCGWCPRGIVGMETMQELYGDEDFIGIAIHSGDQMENSQFRGFLNHFANSFPNCAINRSIVVDPSTSILKSNYTKYAGSGTYATVGNVEVSYDEATKTVGARAEATFVIPVVNGDYRFVFEVVEDNVGPYDQANYYSGSGQLLPWGKDKEYVSTMFNMVGRATTTWDGIEGSVPANLEPGRPVGYFAELNGRYIKDINNCTLVALLVNGKNGEIVNAEKLNLKASGVDKAYDEAGVKIIPAKGQIVIEGDYSHCTVYGIDGRLVSEAKSGNIAAAPGIFIVKVVDANGVATTRKVIVR